MSIFEQGIGDILDQMSDVIEGGNTYASGTSYRGIPGRRSNDQQLRNGNDTPIVASDNGTTTTVPYASGLWSQDRWVKNDTPGYFLLCTTAGDNKDAARRITAWNTGTLEFTTDAFPAAVSSSDSFTVLQGFKRIPNGVDIEQEGTESSHGFDRFFHLRATSGRVLDWYGNGTQTFETTLELRLRMLRYARAHDIEASAFENLAIMRSVLTRPSNPDHRESTYTVALLKLDEESEIVVDDPTKIVVVDRYRLVYRISTLFA